MPWLLVALVILGCASWSPKPPQVFVDEEALVVGVLNWRVDLVRDCGIEQSLLRRDFDALYRRISDNDWLVLIFLNQIQAVEIRTDSGEFECGIASKAYGPAA